MYTEFLAAALAAQANIEEDRIAEAFDRLDADDSGFISRQNLKEFLGADNAFLDAEAIIEKADADKDGKSKYLFVFSCLSNTKMISSVVTHTFCVCNILVSWDEFLQLFRQQHTKRMSEIQHLESTVTEGDANLIGLDAKIPGGRFDSTVSSS